MNPQQSRPTLTNKHEAHRVTVREALDALVDTDDAQQEVLTALVELGQEDRKQIKRLRTTAYAALLVLLLSQTLLALYVVLR